MNLFPSPIIPWEYSRPTKPNEPTKPEALELDNVSYREMMQFDQDKFIYYHRLGRAMNPNAWDLEEITEWPYGKVKELQMYFNEDIMIDQMPVILAFGFSTKKKDRNPEMFWQMKWHKVFAHFNHLTKELAYIVEKEKALAYEPDADQESAGIDRINKFGVFATVDSLAKGDIRLYREIEEIQYKVVFAKLYYDSEVAKYMDNLRRIKSKSK